MRLPEKSKAWQTCWHLLALIHYLPSHMFQIWRFCFATPHKQTAFYSCEVTGHPQPPPTHTHTHRAEVHTPVPNTIKGLSGGVEPAQVCVQALTNVAAVTTLLFFIPTRH